MASVTQPILQAVKNTIAENFGGASHNLAQPEHQFSLEKHVPDLSPKVALVTGGSEGIGYGITHTLLSHNISKLFVLAVDKKVMDSHKEALTRDMGSEIANKITFLQCDLSDWSAVANITKQITSQTDRLDILVNTAARGIMTYELTDFNVDRHMAINHMGHVILTSHLLPLLKETSEKGNTVRIVCFGSNAHPATPSDCKFASLDELNQDLGPNGQYGRSKLAQMLYAKYLSKHLTPYYPKILANSVHPGFVETKASTQDIHEAFPVAGYGMSVLMDPFKKDVSQGCVSAVFCATKTEEIGQYVCPPAVPEAGSSQYQSDELMEQLMKLTTEIVEEKTGAKEEGCPMKFA